jgi:hypothetical protein
MNFDRLEINEEVIFNSLEMAYSKLNLIQFYKKDFSYLKKALKKMEVFWHENLKKIEKINLIIICESPLWGENEKYFYNPETPHSQFIYCNDFNFDNNIDFTIKTKEELINHCNKLGILIIDVSPFALNDYTEINYGKLKSSDYKKIIVNSLEYYFYKKIDYLINQTDIQINSRLKIVYRYKRVQKALSKLIERDIKNKFKLDKNYVFDCIVQSGGGIDKNKLENLINNIWLNN